jgi:hypothetical protein
MDLSPAVKLFIFLTVPLTLGFKAVTGEPDSYESKAAISEFLSRYSFEIQEQTVAGIPTLVATSCACRMIVAEGSPNGWTRDMTRQILGLARHRSVGHQILRRRAITMGQAIIPSGDHRNGPIGGMIVSTYISFLLARKTDQARSHSRDCARKGRANDPVRDKRASRALVGMHV